MEIEAVKSSFKNKKVFVTGHTGFKGAWLVNLLHILGAQIKGYALPPDHESDLYNATQVNTLCQSVYGDIMDLEKLKHEVLEFQPDFIFHLAAQPLVRLSYEKPLETFLVNAQGSAHLLEALRSLQKACVCTMITTDKVYHNFETGHYYAEDDKLGGYDPYSASKACAELVIDSYRNSFFNSAAWATHKKSVSVARAGNVIGGGDWAKDRIVPDIIRALQQNMPVTVRNPNSVRPWQHVLEPLFGYLVLAANQQQNPQKFATAFNFGPGKNDILPVSELVTQAIKNWGSGSFNTPATTGQVHEAGLLHLDILKAKQLLNWAPKINSDQTIHMTVEWYTVFFKDQKHIIDFTKQQINNYLKLHND